MRIVSLAVAVAAALAFTAPAGAQEQKKKKQESNQGASSTNDGMQSCRGLLWVGSSCRHPDGRVCQVTEGTSGNANLQCSQSR